MSTTTIRPTREQSMTALARANEIRIGNSITYQELKRMPRSTACCAVAEILLDDDAVTGAMRVGRLLATPRRIGTAKAAKLLNLAEVRSADRQLRQLSARQRRVLALGLLEMSTPAHGRGHRA